MAHPSATPTTTPEIPAVLTCLAELVATGKFRAARRAAASLIDQADPHTLVLISRCAEALQNDRHCATAALDELWLTASDTDAAIITACLPGPDYTPDLPTPAPELGWKRQVRWVAPSPVQVRRGPVTTPTHVATSYHAVTEEHGIDERTPNAASDGYELDYDLAAMHHLRGTPCVSCWIERSSADQHRGQWDDGLCGECRDTGQPGIPAPPVGHTRVDAIRARCQFIANTDTSGRGGLPTLRAEYRRANASDRAVITAWVRSHRT